MDKYAAAADALWLKQAPTFGAVLVLELHRDPVTNAYSVRMVSQVSALNTSLILSLPWHSHMTQMQLLSRDALCDA